MRKLLCEKYCQNYNLLKSELQGIEWASFSTDCWSAKNKRNSFLRYKYPMSYYNDNKLLV